MQAFAVRPEMDAEPSSCCVWGCGGASKFDSFSCEGASSRDAVGLCAGTGFLVPHGVQEGGPLSSLSRRVPAGRRLRLIPPRSCLNDPLQGSLGACHARNRGAQACPLVGLCSISVTLGWTRSWTPGHRAVTFMDTHKYVASVSSETR